MAKLLFLVAVTLVGIASVSGAPDVDCDDFCSSGGHGRGSAIGTAPFCGASCSSDCAAGNFCQEPWSEGAGCATGHKICCCSKAEEPEKPTLATSQIITPDVDCDDFCSSGGHGRGSAIGTAPFCGASCSSDCGGGNFCQEPWSEGAGCATGHKICCCSKAEEPEKPTLNTSQIITPDVDCDDFCSSGGHGRGSAIGTAPFCGASCSSDCASGNFCQEPWSEGAGCATGHKICCCSQATVETVSV